MTATASQKGGDWAEEGRKKDARETEKETNFMKGEGEILCQICVREPLEQRWRIFFGVERWRGDQSLGGRELQGVWEGRKAEGREVCFCLPFFLFLFCFLLF